MMRAGGHELPAELKPVLRRAVVLEWVTLAYMALVIGLMGLVMGGSQAMRTAWIEDLLSLIPPIAFLVTTRLRKRPPNQRYPDGYHRSVSIAFLVAALALLTFGLLLLYNAASTLIAAEHPTLGSVDWFGPPVWIGWVMLPVLMVSVVGPVILGRLKVEPARRLHDKTLFTDAQMNKADWTTGLAAAVGVIGVGAGLWWADAAAAGLISLSVLRDGIGSTRAVVGDLMDRTPQTVDHAEDSPIPERVRAALAALPWAKAVHVRLRESGHVMFGEAWIVPVDEADPLARTDAAAAAAEAVDWRVHQVLVHLTAELPDTLP